jgi:anti-sigma factor RsiW
MNCPLWKEETAHILLDYSAGRLDTARLAVLERHMESCAECAAFRTEQAAVWDALDAWKPSPVSLDFNRRLRQRIDAADAAPWYKRLVESLRVAPLRISAWKPVLPLTAAILIIAAGFLFDHSGGRAPAPRAAADSVSATEAEQVEQALDDIQLLRQLNTSATPGSAKKM